MKKTVLCLLLGLCFMALGVQGQLLEVPNLDVDLSMTDIQPNGEIYFFGSKQNTNRALDLYPTIGIISPQGLVASKLSYNFLSYKHLSAAKCSTGRYVVLASLLSRDARLIDTLHIYTFSQSQMSLSLQKTIIGKFRGGTPTYSPISSDTAILSFQDSAIIVNPNNFNRITSFAPQAAPFTRYNLGTLHRKLFGNVILSFSDSFLLTRIEALDLTNRTQLPFCVPTTYRTTYYFNNYQAAKMKRVRDSIYAWGLDNRVVRGHIADPASDWLSSQYLGLSTCHSGTSDGDTSFMVSNAYTGPGVSPTNDESVVLVSFNHFSSFQVWTKLNRMRFGIIYYFDRKFGKAVYCNSVGKIFVSSQIATALPSAVNTIRPVQVFPNPATNSLSFPQEAITFGPQTRVTAVDMLGKTTMLLPDPSTQQLDISTLNQGAYLLSWEVNGLFYRSKFVKE